MPPPPTVPDGRRPDRERLPVVQEVSAGGVVYRPSGKGPEVCLIATRGRTRWQLPKGRIEPGEPAEAAALREVREETGLEARLLEPLARIDFWYAWGAEAERKLHHKVVHFYLLAFERGDTADHDGEVDEACWFPLVEALDKVSFKNEKLVLRQAGVKLGVLKDTGEKPRPARAPARRRGRRGAAKAGGRGRRPD